MSTELTAVTVTSLKDGKEVQRVIYVPPYDPAWEEQHSLTEEQFVSKSIHMAKLEKENPSRRLTDGELITSFGEYGVCVSPGCERDTRKVMNGSEKCDDCQCPLPTTPEVATHYELQKAVSVLEHKLKRKLQPHDSPQTDEEIQESVLHAWRYGENMTREEAYKHFNFSWVKEDAGEACEACQ